MVQQYGNNAQITSREIEVVRKLPRGKSVPHSTADIHEKMCSDGCSALWSALHRPIM